MLKRPPMNQDSKTMLLDTVREQHIREAKAEEQRSTLSNAIIKAVECMFMYITLCQAQPTKQNRNTTRNPLCPALWIPCTGKPP
ncbi:hypothetical protein AAFF_G00422450 [Aldrovandia affinis]|uniref:Uncharacterized protein n=1 Tax=Aldrovandia affinis TaxID=143900 RepID=A0AAD7T6H9_9TELE|nr:hypothetical protein AAFF_G00422450 [Aldrovandia affinis]